MPFRSAVTWFARRRVISSVGGTALEQTANVCERRIMEQENVPVAEKIISLSDPDASFIVKGGWNTVLGYRPQLARSGRGFVTGLMLPRGRPRRPTGSTPRARYPFSDEV